MDTASEVEELEADSVSLLPAAPEGSRGGARIQVFLARYRWAPHPCSPFPQHLGGTAGRGLVKTEAFGDGEVGAEIPVGHFLFT